MRKRVLQLAALLILSCAPLGARGEKISIVVSGKQARSESVYRAEGGLYLDAKLIGALYGGQVYWYPVSGRVHLSLRGRSLQFVAGSDKAAAGDKELRLDEAVIVRASRALVPLSFLTSSGFASWSGRQTRYDARTKTLVVEKAGGPKAQPAAPAAPAAAAKRRRLVVIDPGHGGKDPGATGSRGTREKDVNLAVALELSRLLRERGDFDALLTRDADVFIPLSDRSDLANEKNADLFVSLHCNAAGDRRENGFEVYSVSEAASDPAAEALAATENAVLELEGKNPQDEMAKMILLAMTKTEMINESAAFSALAAKAIGKSVDVESRGAKQAGFYVLRGTHAPAILIEMAFVSHVKDEAKLVSRRFRTAMAEGAAAGIADYARRQGWLD
ncbi:MAG: N-acetylmuramoyl-L-alanine amidase [Elusimicrobia bacterium]|nr:N-acetylmuramoyl-L-alanine amidase [Elusimicrobiota bacterium]